MIKTKIKDIPIDGGKVTHFVMGSQISGFDKLKVGLECLWPSNKGMGQSELEVIAAKDFTIPKSYWQYVRSGDGFNYLLAKFSFNGDWKFGDE